jgi:mannan endo-1,4-beta-mannosidase
VKFSKKALGLLAAVLWTNCSLLLGASGDQKPVTPSASPEARALLQLFYGISGKYTLAGQHNYPGAKARNTEFASKYVGKTPAVFTTDWGFAREGDFDSHLARPAIVEEIKRQHELGSIISICWHAVPPTADEPVTFRPLPGSSPDSLASVQGRLTDQQFKDVLTPGTRLYKRWCAQVDSIAFYLKRLQDAHIPILWRPYHEMNGEWFWWGGRHGKYGTAALYKQLFDRFAKHHKLRNLIWEWSIDRPAEPQRQFSYYYPGSKYFDIVALDVYGSDFNQSYYDSLVVLSNGKPMVLAEVGSPPSLGVFQNQPQWSYYAIWAGMVRNTLKRQFADLMSSPRILCLEDSAYCNAIAPYRRTCGLPPLTPVEIKPVITKADFSGTWMFNEESSVLNNSGASFLPYTQTISQNDSILVAERTYIMEYADDRNTSDTLILDGKDHASVMFNAPRTTKTSWSPRLDTLIIESRVTFDRGGQKSEMTLNESWTLREQGNVLSIHQVSDSSFGKRDVTLIFDKKCLR